MPSEVRLKKKTEQLKEGLKSSILKASKPGVRGGPPGSASGVICTRNKRAVTGCNQIGRSCKIFVSQVY